jgi:hypothetical protein
MSDPIYVEKDALAAGANSVFGGRRYWIAGYCEGDGIWNDDKAPTSSWSNNASVTSIWTDDATASGTWTDD